VIHKLLAPHADRAYALLRIVSGLLFLCHGLQKLFGLLGGTRPPVGSQHWIGGVIELVAGTAIALGLQASWAAFVASGMMAVAYVQFHWRFAFDAGFFPVVNRGELALLYCFLFLFVACRGPGPFSLDARLRRFARGG
jgi:putative oxidoreductase